jgi:hypothetical protein
MHTGPFISEQNPTSRRWAVFEDDGVSGWLYLTEPGSENPTSDCWVYNCVGVTESADKYMARGVAPPAPASYTDTNSEITVGDESAFGFRWAEDGESVAIFINDLLMGFIISGQKRGYSRNLVKNGPWGNPLDEGLYKTVFGEASNEAV